MIFESHYEVSTKIDKLDQLGLKFSIIQCISKLVQIKNLSNHLDYWGKKIKYSKYMKITKYDEELRLNYFNLHIIYLQIFLYTSKHFLKWPTSVWLCDNKDQCQQFGYIECLLLYVVFYQI